MSDRLLAVAGGHNFRDFGGYPTRDGRRVRRGVLFRSGVLSHIEPVDQPTLRALGIVTICDLRTRDEREHQPTHWIDSDCEILSDDEVVSLATLQALVADPVSTGAQADAAMVELYRDLPTRHLPIYRQMFRRLVEGRVPLLVNCSAGKDRTGLAAALVLRALGVADDEVMADFVASNDAIDVPRLLADSGYADAFGDRSDVIGAMLTVKPNYLAAAFAEIDAQYGSFARYLAIALRIIDDDLATMRATLLV